MIHRTGRGGATQLSFAETAIIPTHRFPRLGMAILERPGERLLRGSLQGPLYARAEGNSRYTAAEEGRLFYNGRGVDIHPGDELVSTTGSRVRKLEH